MPELPEVETIRRQLEPVLVGQRIINVDVLKERSFSGVVEDVLNREVVKVERKGKMLIIATSNKKQETSYKKEEISFVLVHLKMTGQLIYEATRKKLQDPSNKKQETNNSQFSNSNFQKDRIVGGHPTNSWSSLLPDKHTRIIWKLSGGNLYFNDQRMFGWMKLATNDMMQAIIEKMPPDIIDSEVDDKFLYTVLQSSARPVKVVIMDSAKLGGVGNIYANDALFDAGIDPRRPAKSLSETESHRLLESMKKVVTLGIELGGATAGDGKFVNTTGMGGSYQEKFLVYEQEGKLVERLGKRGMVEKFRLGGRGTYWVPKLQS